MTLTTASLASDVNQRLPSGPATMSAGWSMLVLWYFVLVVTPAVVISTT